MTTTNPLQILTKQGEELLARLAAEEKELVIDKFIFADVPDRGEFPSREEAIPHDYIVHEEPIGEKGRLTENSVIYTATLASDVGPFYFNWSGLYCSEHNVLVTIHYPKRTPKTQDQPGIAGNTLVRSQVLQYTGVAEITNITVDASTWQYNSNDRLKKMDADVAQAIIDQNGKDWFIGDGFQVLPKTDTSVAITPGAGYVSGNRVSLGFERIISVPTKPAYIYLDAKREGTPTGEQITTFNFVVSAEEKDDYLDSSTGKQIPHFVCKIAQVHADGSVSDLRPEGESASRDFVDYQVGDSVGESFDLKVWPPKFGKVADVGDVIPEGTTAIRIKDGNSNKLYMLSGEVSGVLTDIDTINKTIEVSSVVVNEVKSYLLFPTKFSQKSTVYLGDFIDDINYLEQILGWNAGGRVILTEGKVYTMVDDHVDIPKNTRVDLNNSACIFEQSGTDLGFQLSDGAKLYHGSVFVTGEGQGGAGASKSCVSCGNQSTGQGVKGTEVHDIIVNTNRVNGNGIVYFGECSKNKVYNIGFPDSDTMGRVVAFEWGGTEEGTGHPNNNEIKNIQGGNLSLAQDDSFVVWMSSCFNMDVTNVNPESANGIVGIFTGDKASEHAPEKYKKLIGTGIVVNNPTGKIKRFGIRVYGKGSDVDIPVSQRPIINNPTFEGTGLSDLELGILCEFTEGVTVNDPNISKVGTGIVTGAQCKQLIVNGGEIYLCRNNGIRYGNSGGIQNCLANFVRLYKNNQAGNVGTSSAAAIAIAHSLCSAIKGCKFGLPGEPETQQYSIYVEVTSKFTSLNDNHTYSLKSGGVAYVNGLSTNYDMETMGGNNTVEPGIVIHGGAPIYQINSMGKKHFVFAAATGFPIGGTWKAGDSFDYSSPLPSTPEMKNYKGGVFTAAQGWIGYGETASS
ncbi:hypothetical protein BOO22_16180 [Vibrio cidicii]|uniref:phage tail-collar fiber domain-containing protein n=1 Tax=Vibrio cidicii TaxID=1763883 RepID=UPI0018C28ABA|nr:phage tail protein [Vibrio cidicii]MBG0760948.1 hypothetical protein [Vibrio cidicii]